MTELELQQLELKCNEANFLSSNILNVSKVAASLRAAAAEHDDEEEYLKNRKINVTYCGYPLSFIGRDFLDLLEKTRVDCENRFEDLKICDEKEGEK